MTQRVSNVATTQVYLLPNFCYLLRIPDIRALLSQCLVNQLPDLLVNTQRWFTTNRWRYRMVSTSVRPTMQLAFYLRLFLLVCRSISGHLTHTSPTATPLPEERARYTARSTSNFWERGFYIGHAASFGKVEPLAA